MLDDDIQYIGTRPASSSVSSSNPSLNGSQIVSGIVLRIERSGSESSYDLSFDRANAGVIHIGRRPATDAERSRSGNTERAMFRCAVVSRKHAKIAFSDSGHVYLIDMKSHHGTHIRKPGETISRKLKPETPTQLADGDVLTFGKSVGRNNEYVRPVVARVELIYSRRTELTPFKSTTPVKASNQMDLTKSPSPRSHSGRYGVYVPASPSSEDLSSPSSDHDSDIEELPASGPNALPLLPRGGPSAGSESESPIGRAFEALKRLLPPMHPILAPGAAHEDRPSEEPITLAPLMYAPTSSHLPFESSGHFSPIYSPAWSLAAVDSPGSDLDRERRSPIDPWRLAEGWCIDRAYPEEEEESERHSLGDNEQHSSHPRYAPSYEYHNRERSKSRSNSPMDLASPSPALPPGLSLSPEEPVTDPSVIGAWPDSRSASRHPSSSGQAQVEEHQGSSVDADPPAPSVQKAMSLDAMCSCSGSSPHIEAQQPSIQAEGQAKAASRSASPNVEALAPSGAGPQDMEGITKTLDANRNMLDDMQATVLKLQTEITKLQTHRRKYKTRFDTNAHLVSDRLGELDERVADVSAQCAVLAEQVDVVAEGEIPGLLARVEALGEHVDGIAENDSEEDKSRDRDDVKESAETLRQLVIEMRDLREATQKQMDAELEAVRAARDEVLATMRKNAATVKSLKRKRIDEADEGSMPVNANESDEGMIASGGVTADVTMADAAVTSTLLTNTPSPRTIVDTPSPRKRARRIAAVAVQTATAVTVGAIATWTALAFS